MTPDEVELQFVQFLGLNFYVGEFAKTGADPIDDLALFKDFLDDRARFANSIACAVG